MANKLPNADKLSKLVLSGSDPEGLVTGYVLTPLQSSGTLYPDAAPGTFVINAASELVAGRVVGT